MQEVILVLAALVLISILNGNNHCLETASHKCQPTSVNEDF